MRKAKIAGLYWDKKTEKGSVDKRVEGVGRVRAVFTASSQKEAEGHYHRIIAEAKTKAAQPKYKNFTEAATKYLNEATIKSLGRNAISLANLVPFIGHLTLDEIHQGTIQPYINHRREQGVKSRTVDLELSVVRRIMVLASRVWRDENNKPWLPTAPLILSPDWDDKAEAYPLTSEEQRRLIKELPEHLAEMALFALNTGARDNIVTNLQWKWEMRIPELNTSVFLVPGDFTKNHTTHLIVLNATARRIIESRRGKIESHVFGYKDKPVDRIYNTAWKKAWKRAKLPVGKNILSGPHNLRHTFARRLRSVGVTLETRKALMHHIDGDITTHYSPAEIKELIEAVEKLPEAEKTTMLRVVNG